MSKQHRPANEPRKPNGVDRSIGAVVARRREELRLSLEQAGQGVGVSGEQWRRYEAGETRIGASRLFDIAHFLGMPLSSLFEGVRCCETERDSTGSLERLSLEEKSLIKAFRKVSSSARRRRLIELAGDLASQPEASGDAPPARSGCDG